MFHYMVELVWGAERRWSMNPSVLLLTILDKRIWDNKLIWKLRRG